jgi:hypothetical protein
LQCTIPGMLIRALSSPFACLTQLESCLCERVARNTCSGPHNCLIELCKVAWEGFLLQQHCHQFPHGTDVLGEGLTFKMCEFAAAGCKTHPQCVATTPHHATLQVFDKKMTLSKTCFKTAGSFERDHQFWSQLFAKQCHHGLVGEHFDITPAPIDGWQQISQHNKTSTPVTRMFENRNGHPLLSFVSNAAVPVTTSSSARSVWASSEERSG